MSQHLRRALGICLAAWLGSGCASIGAAQLANTNGRGQFQFGIEPAVADWGGIGFPRGDLSLRYGITDRIDIGGKIGTSLAEINGKFQLTDPAHDAFVLSLAPSVGGLFLGSFGLINGALPLLLGIKVGDGHQLIIGPRLQDFLFEAAVSSDSGSAGGVVNVFGAGASVGFSFKITDAFRIMPEVAYVRTLNASAAVTGTGLGTSSTSIAAGANFFQFGLNFLIGTVDQHTSIPEAEQPKPLAPAAAPPPYMPPPPPPPGPSAPPSLPPAEPMGSPSPPPPPPPGP